MEATSTTPLITPSTQTSLSSPLRNSSPTPNDPPPPQNLTTFFTSLISEAVEKEKATISRLMREKEIANQKLIEQQNLFRDRILELEREHETQITQLEAQVEPIQPLKDRVTVLERENRELYERASLEKQNAVKAEYERKKLQAEFDKLKKELEDLTKDNKWLKNSNDLMMILNDRYIEESKENERLKQLLQKNKIAFKVASDSD